jgi:rhodanese-related sulfurtransferase
MIFKKTALSILLWFAICICAAIGIGQSPILASTLAETRSTSQVWMPTLSKPINLKSEVDLYLTSMPAGYYTISSVEKLKSQLENPQTLLIDVRELSEYQSGHIPNAIDIPLRALARNLNRIPLDRPVVLYCSSGYRSAMGVMTLHLLGYEKVQGFPPSFVGWQAAGEAISSS